ncbi:MOSC N-terminal beta barrel domain-containing protein [Streptomyces sp. NPDC048436]|uniref:MOSC N-terminal beta barrel domain-containing protein n=1 Tax=Streptomyces sp. NPDC048436 TaxID=3365550 RepID=UPI0037197E9C
MDASTRYGVGQGVWARDQGRGSAVGMGAVVGLGCFPVKSMLGERCERLVFDERGVAGDRLWALRYEDGVYADVVAPGTLAIGSKVTVQ